jgi:hypothetical protein
MSNLALTGTYLNERDRSALPKWQTQVAASALGDLTM